MEMLMMMITNTNTPRPNPDTCLVRLDGQIYLNLERKLADSKIPRYVWSGQKKSNYNFALKERKYE